MFTQADWEQTQFYKDVRQKSRLEMIPNLLKIGLTLEQIAYALELDIEIVRKEAQKHNLS